MFLNIEQLSEKTKEELLDLGKEAEIVDLASLKRDNMIFQLMKYYAQKEGHLLSSGLLEIVKEGYGFLRQESLKPGAGDVYVSQSQIRRFALRTGDHVTGQVRPPKDGERYHGLIRVEAVNTVNPDAARERAHFENLTPIYPEVQIKLETDSAGLSRRVIDLFAPIGRGQRGLIVSPPKAGKTTLLKDIATGITANWPDINLIAVLAGERPEEVTDMKRSIAGEVYSATFDEPVEDHCRVSEFALERAKRLVECGNDVVILLDSITRLTRAYNLALPSTGRTLSGGIDPSALYPPKRFFGAARNSEEGGSLTIIAACLVDTGSRMDEVIYEEFKGTGNMEVHLSRRLSERRVFPSIDFQQSGTRREELILEEETLKQVWLLRRMATMLGDSSSGMDSNDATEKVLENLRKSETNADFLASLNKEVKKR